MNPNPAYPAALADLGRIRTAVTAAEAAVERARADDPRDDELRVQGQVLLDARERLGDLERCLRCAWGLDTLRNARD